MAVARAWVSKLVKFTNLPGVEIYQIDKFGLVIEARADRRQ